ncbi:type 4 prepilin peptidase 1 Aspartic peptidase. MEROPS family A24A [Nitrosomonas cryotolerans]|uniref:Prepilin leader peptidase/N-methyltransferase n=1 Tax=Nitrosomonas cryotolerans ATCC 49181 TaxID=1131553 RepID=A0A1N6FEW1_9PROT|nr:A24 family peptidase [Nitrosomonas cryotolerans]SFP63451.1 type 4 prepilin peptidase 1 Aspartic peptidase. MEROPS family A24A [Nitrosomonas cryotolerans]SIN93780.1 type 4 prepilin peptidase 1 Aspartic peptidase. MEROPS family A24A [Nitrosomonas cryotolerans ATCC 49181]
MSFISLLHNTPSFFITFIIIIGLMVGSFLNVLIYRLPKMMEQGWRQQCAELRGESAEILPTFNIATPRSICFHCGHKITILENIPILSYLALRGRCSRCHHPISLRYPIVEMLTSIMSGFTAWYFGYSLITIAALIFVWAMIALTFIDLDTQLLPDDITLPLLWIGLLINLNNGFTDIHSAVIGAMVGYLSLWSIYWCFKLATGKEGMGHGDFKLLAVTGGWLGWNMLPLVILFSSFVGAIVGVSLILTAKHDKDSLIPFGPYLAGGSLIALFWGEELNNTYLGLF